MAKKSKKQVQEEVDYGAVVDNFIEEAEEDALGSDESASEDESKSESGNSSGSENQDEHDDEDEEAEESDEEEEEEVVEQPEIKQPVSKSGEPCTFDLRNLLALNIHQVDSKKLYSSKAKKDDEVTIDTIAHTPDDKMLLKKATDGCAQLIDALWQLPTTKSDVGPMATLPTYDESNIPRALPPPEPKQETKWEKFAKDRGIPLNKNKRSQKVFDEATGEWMYRHGYNKANHDEKEWPIMEVKGNQDPYEDPWERMRQEKKSKTDKNLESQLRNKERNGLVPKGTATRIMKSKAKTREAGLVGGRIDRENLPSGIPVDMKDSSASSKSQRGMTSTQKALLATQVSTASLGRFDRPVAGEPERKKAMNKTKKRKFESATEKKVLSTETDRSMKVLKSVIEGGGAAREKAIKKGKFAKGETAYDYEFDDGLGASAFRKKKGRAGAGKAKKMTKKRII